MRRPRSMSEGEVLSAAKLHLHEGWSFDSIGLLLQRPRSTVYSAVRRKGYLIRSQRDASTEHGLISTLGPEGDAALRRSLWATIERQTGRRIKK